ncbi:hypothetical protein tinsulaeT_20660 [Thalassotalea insulae]|uniref:Dystroglycan-type cadherin-like domain-containing protein n=2 Tax=Thalassotalea insulae TaxID=2056778 RepID=A0ABQ6GX36_9GAMM|nr:hypothetical protein tinsulaeT_20660 [Thalassotalea insulae]
MLFEDTLDMGNPLMFQVRACNNEGECSAYSEGRITTPLPWPDSPAPAPWVFTVDHFEIVAGDKLTFNWGMHESYSKEVSYNLTQIKPDGSTVQLLTNTGVESYEYQEVLMLGTHLFELQTCNAIKGCVNKKSLSVLVKAPPLTISGEPELKAFVGKAYSFTPNVLESDLSHLEFSLSPIQLPAWLAFNTSTGELSGIPALADVGIIENIVITVSDGQDTDTLEPFNISVINGLSEKIISINTSLLGTANKKID